MSPGIKKRMCHLQKTLTPDLTKYSWHGTPVPKFSRETRGEEGSSVQVTSFAPKHDCIGTKQGGHDSMDKSWQT